MLVESLEILFFPTIPSVHYIYPFEAFEAMASFASESGSESRGDKKKKQVKFASYYDKWHAKAKEIVDEVDAEEDAAEAAAAAAKGIQSAEEKKDMAKRAALKKAKKLWEGRKIAERDIIFELVGDAVEGGAVKEGAEMLVDGAMTGGLPVVEIKSCKGARFVFPPTLKGSKSPMIKIVITDCEDCLFVVGCPLLVGIDLFHSENCALDVPVVALEAVPQTLQVDLCKKVKIAFRSPTTDLKDAKFKIYHAGVIGLDVEVKGVDALEKAVDYKELMNGAAADEEGNPAEEVQFVTHLLPSGKLGTEKVIRVGQQPTTQRELDEKEAKKPVEDRAKPSSKLRLAELDKIGGNEAFKERDYSQAGVFYSKAIQKVLELPQDPKPDLLHICYSNRAACNLKLGRPEAAFEDAKLCLALAPKYVKGLFRAGLACHAMGKYMEAGPYFAKALEIDPKNKDAEKALQFARMKQQKMMAKLERSRG